MPNPIDSRSDALAQISHDHAVMFPCEPDQFREFVSGLLGKPQTINRIVHGPFEVTRSNIKNLYHLISQRIAVQNDGVLVAFCATIAYNDGSLVSLNSLDDFIAYSEVEPIVSESINLSLTYLVKFLTSTVPEKQQIDITFNGGIVEEVYGYDPFRGITEGAGPGSIGIRVDHTSRSWGIDIDSLIFGFVRGIKQKESKISLFLVKESDKIAFAMNLVFLVIIAVFDFLLVKYISNMYSELSLSINKLGIESDLKILRKIDLLLEVYGPGAWIGCATIFVGSWALFRVVSAIVSSITIRFSAFRRPSFVLISPQSELNKVEILRKMSKNWLIITGGFLGTIFVSVLGNYLFYLLLKSVLE